MRTSARPLRVLFRVLMGGAGLFWLSSFFIQYTPGGADEIATPADQITLGTGSGRVALRGHDFGQRSGSVQGKESVHVGISDARVRSLISGCILPTSTSISHSEPERAAP